MFRDTLTLIFTKKLYDSFGVNFQNINTTPNYATFAKYKFILKLSDSESSSVFPAVYYLNFSDYDVNNPIDFGFSDTKDKDPKIFILNEQLSHKHQ